MNRRGFLRTSGAVTAGALGLGPLSPLGAWAQEAKRSRVASIRNDAVQAAANRLNPSIVRQMLDLAVQHVTGAADATAGWQGLFTKDDVVAIKVNCSGGPMLSTNKTIVDVIVQRLTGLGISPDNIAVYDRTDGALAACGYVLNPAGKGVKCGGVEGHWDMTKTIQQGAFRGHLAQIIGMVTAIINVPILKDAGGAGVTISMKNHFGTIERPSDCHGNGCDPYIADVNAIPEIRTKQRLIVCDATAACFEGGPSADPRYIWRPNRLLVATDPVALDTLGAAMIDAKRQEQGLRTLADSGRKPKQLASAAARGLGSNDLSKVDLLDKTM